jgi:hypothetical protein
MEFGIETKGMDEIMKSIDKLTKGIDPQELTHWSKRIEKIAKQLCNDKLSDITLRSHDKELDLSVKDRKSADCLIKAIETNLPSMPLFMQGVFSKLASDLREAKFNP